ncbi:MAG TPA: glycine--tRNA ligase subunit beta [Candidatus Brocadiia bacterium]|nr:glycine--tRNA ligase subunit beta [Candidatus Brocadiia bacterium]
MKRNLLFEIGSEEIPAGYIRPALDQMKSALAARLSEHGLVSNRIDAVGTPRRLAIFASGVPETQPEKVEEVTGPPARVAFDSDGKPAKAGRGFAEKLGVSVENLRVKSLPKGDYVVVEIRTPGAPAVQLLPQILKSVAESVRFPKSMYWTSTRFTFARPIRSLLALFGEEILPVEINGVSAGRTSAGHPFMSGQRVSISSADLDAYLKSLRDVFVIADHEERKRIIREQLEKLISYRGGKFEEEDLLEEVTFLVEFPNALEGGFNERYLDLPPQIIVAAMKGHQRYFPIRDSSGRLFNKFLVVTNRGAEQADVVRGGNERVLQARLEDARFYWEEDREKPLHTRIQKMSGVQFLKNLGDNLQRSERIRDISGWLADNVFRCGPQDREDALRGAMLSKCDLVTGTVLEFPALQGTMGRLYALADGETPGAAAAIEEHYLPRSAEGALPATIPGSIVSVADKLDVITACFAVGLIPTGSQDPYALRRCALGILRIIELAGVDFRPGDAARVAVGLLPRKTDNPDDVVSKVVEFMADRASQMATDRGYRHDFIQAVLACGFAGMSIPDYWRRLDAMNAMTRQAWWGALVEVVERTYKIYRSVGDVPAVAEESLMQQAEEKTLFSRLCAISEGIEAASAKGEYMAAANEYLALAEPVHDFFDKVFVNVEDQKVRLNRLALMRQVHELFARNIAELALVQAPSPKND